eukprot:CCRYP_018155-RC/>CCRYP_018155-RC protein AED:0.46 eAED:0.46 QI:0/-1/0/1/-1/0/1/0/48
MTSTSNPHQSLTKHESSMLSLTSLMILTAKCSMLTFSTGPNRSPLRAP